MKKTAKAVFNLNYSLFIIHHSSFIIHYSFPHRGRGDPSPRFLIVFRGRAMHAPTVMNRLSTVGADSLSARKAPSRGGSRRRRVGECGPSGRPVPTICTIPHRRGRRLDVPCPYWRGFPSHRFPSNAPRSFGRVRAFSVILERSEASKRRELSLPRG